MAAENTVLNGVEPGACWRHFEALTKIARPSQHEERVVEHIRRWATERGFDLREDAARNLVVRVPATAGREAAPVLVLQGHLDMVCERLPDSPYDPAEGRIGLVRDGDWLTADGTTLGADNGIGIAAMMALAEDESLPHGPLELLMTVNEEVGGPNEGASGLDSSLVSGATLMNLDSEEDGKLTVGSASSTDTLIRVQKPRQPRDASAVTLSVAVSGGLGGHSGTDIARGHANAIKVRRTSAVRGTRRRAVPAGLPRGRQELERNSARRDRDLFGSCRARDRLPCCGRGFSGGDRGRLRQHRFGCHRDGRARGRCSGRVDA